MTVPIIELNDGHAIPQLGLGVFQIPAADTARVVAEALEIGYRHIDTAQMYRNEAGVGEAVRTSALDRADVFVTSKLGNGAHAPDDARRAFERTLATTGLDYVDLFLIHWPLPRQSGNGYVATWKTLEEFKQDGRARSIGVSNFQIEHLERLAADADVVPAVNQIELHPYFGNAEVRAWGETHGIATEAWSPIAKGGVLRDSDGDRTRRGARPLVGAGRPSLASPARDDRLPQVVAHRSAPGELRALRLRALDGRRFPDRRAGPRRGGPRRAASRLRLTTGRRLPRAAAG